MSRRSSAGPRLSRSVVLDAATELLADGGPAGLSMRKLAERLGVVPMALYRHVENKEDLLDGILDLAVRRVRLPPEGLGWREGMAALAHSMRATMLERPAIARLVVDHPNLGPAALDIGERGFGLLRDAGFDDEHTERIVNLVVTFTLGFAALESQRMEPVGNLDTVYDSLPVEQYPHTVALRPDSARNFVGDDQFAFCLERILDGIEVLRGS